MQVKKQPLKSDMDQQTGSKLGKEYVKAVYCHSDGECSHKIKRPLLLGRKAMANLDSILKADTLLCHKSPSRQRYVFPVVMYGCESWTIKRAESQRTDTFEMWCWRRLSRVLWTAGRSNQSILKEVNPEYSLEGLRLKLKLQSFGQLM